MRFPFVIKNKSVIVTAPTYANALDRVLYKHRNKFVKTKYAKNVAKHKLNMDLIDAQKDAKAQSKAKKNQLIYVILEGDEFIIKDFMAVKEKDDVYSIWRDGAKYDEPEKEEPVMKVTKRPTSPSPLAAEKNESQKTVNKTKMKTKAVKKSAPKKAAKKVAAPKKEVGETKVPRGNNMFLTPAEWKKVDALLAKEETTFSAWSRGLVQSKIKGA